MSPRWISDFVASEKYTIYTRANAGEVMPDPVSPLTSSLIAQGAIEPGWRDAYVRAGTMDRDEFEPDRPNCIGVLGGYLYLNMSLTRLFGVRMPGLTPEMVDLQYFGDMPGITPYAEETRPTDESPDNSARLDAFLQENLVRDDLPELRADRDETIWWVQHRPELATLSNQGLVDYARSHIALSRRLFCRHIIVSSMCGIGIGTVAAVCQAINRPDLITTLVAGAGDVDSAAPSWALWELSRLVQSSRAMTAAFDAGVAGLLASIHELADGGNETAAAFLSSARAFSSEYGFRGPNEWELRSATWGADLSCALAAIDRMRLAADADDPRERTRRRIVEREAATTAVRAVIASNPQAATNFELGQRAALLWSAGRERTKTNSIRILNEQRVALKELGRRMSERGVLDHADELFMLTDDELDEFLERPERFSDAIHEREKTYRSLSDVEPPFVTRGAPPPVSEWERRSEAVEEAPTGTVLTGIAGSPGVVVGRARVVLVPSDPRGLEPGDILIAPRTDPAWTPLFVPAAGVVVDVGAQITHAVIVSRELGLPCVVSVTRATRVIPDGALIEVDGSSGTVTILDATGRARA